MSYQELIDRQTKEANDFAKGKIYFIFAGSETEFKRKLAELGLNRDELLNIGGGGYLIGKYKKEFKQLLYRHSKEKHDYLMANIYEVVKYYLWDFEMEISISMTLNELLYDFLGLTKDQVKENANIINKAIDDYKKEFYECN